MHSYPHRRATWVGLKVAQRFTPCHRCHPSCCNVWTSAGLGIGQFRPRGSSAQSTRCDTSGPHRLLHPSRLLPPRLGRLAFRPPSPPTSHLKHHPPSQADATGARYLDTRQPNVTRDMHDTGSLFGTIPSPESHLTVYRII